MIVLKPFQEEAIANLRRELLQLWQTGNHRIDLTFKSPTGSGKTIMMAQFLKDLVGDPQFDADKAFLWISFSEDSYVQSKRKLLDYYGGAGEITLLDLNDLNRKKLKKNNLFFINWQKIKTSTKEGRLLRKETERTEWDKGVFDEFIIRTQREGRDLVLIIDEAHTQTGTELAQEIIDLIDPRIVVHVTATPKTVPSPDDIEDKKAGYVRVKRDSVVESGLIKEKIVTQAREDVEKIATKELDQDHELLEMACNKRLELVDHYGSLGIKNINPLILIQLPNDDQARKETLDKTKEEVVRDYLRNKGVKDNEIAVWLSGRRENLDLEEIKKNDSGVSFLIFKQAAATGWDCPRAHVLVMFREIRDPTFHTQTVGRILRMPEGNHYDIPELNFGYLYTNYERNQIEMPDNTQGENKPLYLPSKRREGIREIVLQSTHLSRTDYNDLGWTFQLVFDRVADNFFGTKEGHDHDNPEKIAAEGIEMTTPDIPNKLIVDAEIENYDNFVQEIKEKGSDLETDISQNDLERTYNLLCFNIIAGQEEEGKKFAPERSWSLLKTALNVWFQKRVPLESEEYYRIIVKDLLMETSVLRRVIAKALEAYKPVRQKEVKQKERRKERSVDLAIPRQYQHFTEDYEPVTKLGGRKLVKCAMAPLYMLREYPGKTNEGNFAAYLEANDRVAWWHKQGNAGSANFAVKYEDEVERLFYPDWIIMLRDGVVLIVDTKGGFTRESSNTKLKADALQTWLRRRGSFFGGIVAQSGGIWKINRNDSYDPDFSKWEDLDTVIDEIAGSSSGRTKQRKKRRKSTKEKK